MHMAKRQGKYYVKLVQLNSPAGIVNMGMVNMGICMNASDICMTYNSNN